MESGNYDRPDWREKMHEVEVWGKYKTAPVKKQKIMTLHGLCAEGEKDPLLDDFQKVLENHGIESEVRRPGESTD